MIINMNGYIFIRSLFCVDTQSSDAMRLIFHAKLIVRFKASIYAGFILLKKCAHVLKIECAMECPPS